MNESYSWAQSISAAVSLAWRYSAVDGGRRQPGVVERGADHPQRQGGVALGMMPGEGRLRDADDRRGVAQWCGARQAASRPLARPYSSRQLRARMRSRSSAGTPWNISSMTLRE